MTTGMYQRARRTLTGILQAGGGKIHAHDHATRACPFEDSQYIARPAPCLQDSVAGRHTGRHRAGQCSHRLLRAPNQKCLSSMANSCAKESGS